MITFKNDPGIKSALVDRMNKHIELDELLQGGTGNNGKGCTVWCALNNGDLKEGYNHAAFESVLGLPEWLARLQDTIFEGLTIEDAKWFSSQWVKAIPVGKDITPVKWKFCAFILKQNIERVLLLDIKDELKKQVVDAISNCLSVHENAVSTGTWDESAAKSAESAAWSAWSAAKSAESAAWSAEYAAKSAAWSAAKSAESAAWSAAKSAESAAWSAESAAESAAWSAAWSAKSAAKSASYKLYAHELLKLFSEL